MKEGIDENQQSNYEEIRQQTIKAGCGMQRQELFGHIKKRRERERRINQPRGQIKYKEIIDKEEKRYKEEHDIQRRISLCTVCGLGLTNTM